MKNLVEHTQSILTSHFPQSNLCSQDKFIKFLKSIDIEMNSEHLEYFHKKGILEPIAKLNRQIINQQFQKYDTVIEDIHSTQQYFMNGDLVLLENYEPWKNYQDGLEESAILYYHPFQFISIRRLTFGLYRNMSPIFFENEQDLNKWFYEKRDIISSYLSSSRESYMKTWVPRIGLLMLLDEPYGPLVKNFKISMRRKGLDQLKEWENWKLSKFNPESILKSSSLSTEQVIDFYDSLCREARTFDPLANWYPLQRIIRRSELFRLKNNALCAQIYYELSQMVFHFIYDLTGKRMPEPDDILDARKGIWKEKIYGKPFNYYTKQTQKRILDTFLIESQYQAGIIFEGKTEQIVIENILDALRIDKDKNGFFLYNAGGSDNIVQNLVGLYNLSNLEKIELFLILDNDEKAKNIQDRLKQFVKSKNITVWNNDFEYDNFGVDRVLNEVNSKLELEGFLTIEKDEVMSNINKSNETLMRVLDRIIRKNNNGLKMDAIISKVELAEKLSSFRVAEIEVERFQSGWKPQLPIEITLKHVFEKIPKWSFSTQNDCYS